MSGDVPATTSVSEVLLKADDQLLQLARMFRKAEAYDMAKDLHRDIASFEERIKDIEGSKAKSKDALRLSLSSSKQALQQALERLFQRVM
jgi:hypothetical protein